MTPRTSTRRFATLIVAAGLAASAVALPSAATAAKASYDYLGYAGGTKATLLGTTVSSDLTAQSSVTGNSPQSRSNNVAKVAVKPLIAIGAITTDATDTSYGDGSRIVSHAKTAAISLLNGLIRADAVDTTATAQGNSSAAPSADSTTSLLNLTIAGKKYPATVPANTTIKIPGIASVVLNYDNSGANGQEAATMGAGLVVTLLRARGGADIGSQIMVNPVYSVVGLSDATATGGPVGGYSYGSYVTAHAGDSATVESGKTAPVSVPYYGTNGDTLTNSTAKVNVPGVLRLGAIESSGTATRSAALSDVLQTVSTANVNLFNGLITANAIATSAHARLAGGTPGLDGTFDLVNLRIAGKAIPADVPPNTAIDVAHLGTVTINERKVVSASNVRGIQVTGLHIVLDTSRAGLPVGASIEVATSGAIVYGS